MPQARNAASTTAAKGFADHDPNDASTEVATGSGSSPATTPARSGCASVTANAFTITRTPTLRSASQIANGTWRAARLVSSDAPTQASKPMNTQPATARAASIPAPTEPPERASAPSASPRIDTSWVRNTRRSAIPMPTEATISAAIPALITRPSTSTLDAPTTAQTPTRTIPVTTIAFGVGSMPASVKAHGAPR
jgi:hypothetical protein